jgi:hypothetical protein
MPTPVINCIVKYIFFAIIKFMIKFLVVDCDVTCPTDTCGGEQVTCSRTCANGDFGIDAECLSENETKSVTCPALPGSACGMLQYFNTS